MTDNIRRQLTLFVEPQDAEAIEQIRQTFNPVQFDLIRCHVTLCREDEIENLEHVINNLLQLTLPEIVIEFEKIKRFDNNKGVLLPATNNHIAFDNVRTHILNGVVDNPRKQEPHITLMHPRNSTCTDVIFRQIEAIDLPNRLVFKTITLIEQRNGERWQILQQFNLPIIN